eukprot:3694959-Rhodomonas_salina.1
MKLIKDGAKGTSTQAGAWKLAENMIIAGTSSIAGTTIALKLVKTAIALAQKHLESLPEEKLMPGTKAFKTDTNTHLKTVTEEDRDIDNNPVALMDFIKRKQSCLSVLQHGGGPTLQGRGGCVTPGGRARGYSPKTGGTGTAGRGYSCGRGG